MFMGTCKKRIIVKITTIQLNCFFFQNQLCHHFHPSVKNFAETLRKGEFIKYAGDPILDFGTISFLDKFAFKNPRKSERLRGGSIMQSLRTRKETTPLNTPRFINKTPSEVEAEHVRVTKFNF